MIAIFRVCLVLLVSTAGAWAVNDSSTPEERAAVSDAAEFGAEGDGSSLDTAAIQAAIDACSSNGVVSVGPGRYVIGTIKLKSDMELRVAEGAELLGSTSLADYARDIQGAVEAPAFDKCLVYAEKARNITISGGGIIDGRGIREHFPVRVNGKLGDRPMLIRFVNCRDLTFSDITLKNAASWCTHLVECDDIVVRDVTLDSHVNQNNDGFDLDGCKHVLIEDCTIRSGDDSICPKSTTTRICEDIVVKDCRVQSDTAAFKCGTSSRGGFKDITVSDCDFSGSRMGVIKLLSVDGGVLENISISDIVMNDVEGPIFIRLGNRGRVYDKPTEQIQGSDVEPEGAPVGSIKNIRISDIKATVTGTDKARQGIMITGIPGQYVEDVLLENIDISYPGGGTAEEAAIVVPEDEARYPEQFFFGVLPSWGAYIRHARNVEFKDVTLGVRDEDKRKRVVLEDVEGFADR